MNDRIDIKMFKPFGSTISEQTLPDSLVKDFLDDLKMIRALPDKERQPYMFGYKLVGSVESEYLVTPKVLLKYKHSFFDVCIFHLLKHAMSNCSLKVADRTHRRQKHQ